MPAAQKHVWRIERRFLCRVESLADLRRFVHEGLLSSRLAPETGDQLVLATHETAANLIRHTGLGPDKSFDVQLQRVEDRLTVRLSHEGAGFEPAAIPAPVFDGSRESGFGLYLIGLCVDSVTYAQEESGTQTITLTRRLDEPES